MLNYRLVKKKNFNNNSSGNFVENPFSKPLMAFILFSFYWRVQNQRSESYWRGLFNKDEQHL